MEDPKQKSGEENQKSNTPGGTSGLFDLNILPKRYRRNRVQFNKYLPWLLFLVLLGLLYPTSILAFKSQSLYKQREMELKQIQATMESYQAGANEITLLESEIDAVHQQRDLITESFSGIDLNRKTWNEPLFLLSANTPTNITLTHISQQDNQIQLEGTADSYQAILNLKDTLEKLEEFHIAQINSISQISEGAAQPLSIPSASHSFTMIVYAVWEETKP